MRAGPCGCSRARWWSSASSRPLATARSSACSKKRHSAAPPQILDHSAQGQWRVCSGDGGCAAVYTRPRDPDRLVVCLDEASKPLGAETRFPIAMKPGQPPRVDCEDTRNGVANLFMMFSPLEGWRHVKVADRRTAVEYTCILKDLADVHFAQAAMIVLVQDNLNTHGPASLYQAFPAAEARRFVERFEWHYTPKHGSWLNLAESEFGVLAARCLDRRIPDKPTIPDEVAAWVVKRNADHTVADWRFTTPNARIKLKSLCPSL
jgi:DDE superfamily endonuclease